MKVFFVLITALLSISLTAQTTLASIDAEIEHDDAQRPCIQLNLDPEPKPLKKAWRDYLNDNYDFKLKGIGFLSNKELLSAEQIVVEQISSNQMDFFTEIIEDENGSQMKVFIRFGYDIYLTEEQHPEAYRALNETLEGFLKNYLPLYYKDRIKETEKRIESLSNETRDLEDKIEDDSAEIIALKKEIETLEEKLESNNESLKIANEKLTKRKEKLDRIKTQLKNL